MYYRKVVQGKGESKEEGGNYEESDDMMVSSSVFLRDEVEIFPLLCSSSWDAWIPFTLSFFFTYRR